MPKKSTRSSVAVAPTISKSLALAILHAQQLGELGPELDNRLHSFSEAFRNNEASLSGIEKLFEYCASSAVKLVDWPLNELVLASQLRPELFMELQNCISLPRVMALSELLGGAHTWTERFDFIAQNPARLNCIERFIDKWPYPIDVSSRGFLSVLFNMSAEILPFFKKLLVTLKPSEISIENEVRLMGILPATGYKADVFLTLRKRYKLDLDSPVFDQVLSLDSPYFVWLHDVHNNMRKEVLNLFLSWLIKYKPRDLDLFANAFQKLLNHFKNQQINPLQVFVVTLDSSEELQRFADSLDPITPRQWKSLKSVHAGLQERNFPRHFSIFSLLYQAPALLEVDWGKIAWGLDFFEQALIKAKANDRVALRLYNLTEGAQNVHRAGLHRTTDAAINFLMANLAAPWISESNPLGPILLYVHALLNAPGDLTPKDRFELEAAQRCLHRIGRPDPELREQVFFAKLAPLVARLFFICAATNEKFTSEENHQKLQRYPGITDDIAKRYLITVLANLQRRNSINQQDQDRVECDSGSLNDLLFQMRSLLTISDSLLVVTRELAQIKMQAAMLDALAQKVVDLSEEELAVLKGCPDDELTKTLKDFLPACIAPARLVDLREEFFEEAYASAQKSELYDKDLQDMTNNIEYAEKFVTLLENFQARIATLPGVAMELECDEAVRAAGVFGRRARDEGDLASQEPAAKRPRGC